MGRNDGPIVEENLASDRGPKRPQDSRGIPLKEHHENEAVRVPQPPPPAPELKPLPCGHHKRGGRNLIVCIDGTANQFGKKNTNVIEIYNLIMKETGDNQRTWYNSGIGTYARPHWRSLKYYNKVVLHKVDLAIAWNFEKTVQAAYQWLSDNYEDGDCIFLFGFSRGAFQVRALSAMIHKVGLIHKGNEMQIPFMPSAYELYADSESDRELIAPVGSAKSKASPEQVAAERTSMMDRLKEALRFTRKEAPVEQAGAQAISMAERFKRAFSRKNVKVHFVGAWNTVSSIGIARGKRVLPGTTDGMGHICYFRHALALDERRVKFLPEYAWGGKTLIPDFNRNDGPPQVMEVWFAGTHSDIGGGNVQNIGMDRSRPPLRWMASEAEALGLRLEPFERELSSSEQIEFQESLTGIWHLFEILPFRRLTFSRSSDCKETTRMPHFWSERKIHKGQKIHSSLILAGTPHPYIPKARPPPREANDAVNEDVGPRLPWPDSDDFEIQPEPESGFTEDRGMRHRLLRPFRRTRTLSSAESRERRFWDELREDGLSNSKGWLEIDVFEYARTVLKRFMEGKEVEDTLKQIIGDHSGEGAQAIYDEVIETISLWEQDVPHAEVKCRLLRTTMDILGDHLQNLKLQKWHRIRVMLAHLSKSDEGKVAEHFLGRYTKDMNSLFELQGHRSWVRAVAISPDGKSIVSGSWDNTIRIWDMETGAQVGKPLLGHGDTINSVAISPDGKFIVSGAEDKTIRIWDAGTGMQVGESLRGHEDWVLSVAFLHDGQHIVSGSRDKTIRIWDAAAGTQVGVPLQGHTDWVRSVAIPPDGKLIVSGSWDRTIRIWDLETGAQVGEPLRGHTDRVNSVAISPDGKRIVSGAYDHTVRIWSAEGIPV
ncbi:hypothetical protein H1R20_g11517, partial [Candolleomyces eurysporus]